MTFNLIDDLSTLTTIPSGTLNKLADKVSYIICNNLEESVLNSDNIMELNVGIGTLILSIEDNSLEYKFIPSQKLETSIVNTIKNKKNPLETTLEKSLVSRILNAYKDMF